MLSFSSTLPSLFFPLLQVLFLRAFTSPYLSLGALCSEEKLSFKDSLSTDFNRLSFQIVSHHGKISYFHYIAETCAEDTER